MGFLLTLTCSWLVGKVAVLVNRLWCLVLRLSNHWRQRRCVHIGQDTTSNSLEEITEQNDRIGLLVQPPDKWLVKVSLHFCMLGSKVSTEKKGGEAFVLFLQSCPYPILFPYCQICQNPGTYLSTFFPSTLCQQDRVNIVFLCSDQTMASYLGKVLSQS